MTRGEGMYHGQPNQVRVEGSVESQQSQVNVVVNRQGHHMVHRDPVSSSTRSCTPLPTRGVRGSDRN